MKKIVSYILIIIFCFVPSNVVCAENDDMYEEIIFEGSKKDELEMLHLLFAKLSYDDLDGYEGETVEVYVKDNPSLYAKEIWEDSLITYEALYTSLVGQWQIYKVYNYNSESGLYAVAFKNDNQVVLSFRGSEMFTENFPLDESNDWLGTDFKFAIFNELSKQFEDADKCYEDLCVSLEKEDGVYGITFSGHSLGGALVAYESILTGCYGYSFDGAVGHMLDLVYYYCYLDITDFTGIDKIKFCNYTDETGYVVADMIQHIYPENMYQVDRKTNIEELNEDDWISGVMDASSHIIWSCVGHRDNKVFFNETVYEAATSTDATEGTCPYTYTPASTIYMDIDENIIDYTFDAFLSYFPWIDSLSFDYEDILYSLLGINTGGRVVLADSTGQKIYGYEGLGARAVDIVMYGGEGDDSLYGYIADDVLISGGGNDFLDGNVGNDTYIIDLYLNSKTYIRDFVGDNTVIIFRNMQIMDISEFSYNSEENILSVGTQQITLEVGQKYENVELYSYDNGALNKIGTVADLTDVENNISFLQIVISLLNI